MATKLDEKRHMGMVGASDDHGDDEVRSILSKMGLSEERLYDKSESGELYNDRLRPSLTEEEIEDAMKIRRFIRGLMVVVGDPGSGKGVFGHVLPWKIKRYFVGRKALLDHKPRPLFGPYLPFDEKFLKEELDKMAEMSNVRGEIPSDIDRKDEERIKKVKDIAQKWVKSERAHVYLSNSVLVLEEFKRYMHNRRPMNPLGITLGHIITLWRHFDILILGMTPFMNEIDRKACQQYITHEVRCTWQSDATALCNVYQTQWVGSRGVLRIQRKPTPIVINGWLERPELGVSYIEKGEGGEEIVHYHRYFDLYNSTFLPSMRPAGR